MGARGHWELLEHSPDSISFKCQMLTIFSGLNSKRLYGSSGKEKESHCLVFTSSRKREFFKVFSRRSRAATAKKCIKNVMHVQSCCFANLNLLLFFSFSSPSPSSLLTLPIIRTWHKLKFGIKNVHVNQPRENQPPGVEKPRWELQRLLQGVVTWLLEICRLRFLLKTCHLRSGSIFVSLCNNIPAGKAKRKPILAVAVRENVWEPLKFGLISG